MNNRKDFKESSESDYMIWPGTSDPYKRKKVIRFLLITAGIGAVAVLMTSFVFNQIIAEQPRNACINDKETNWKISFTVELVLNNEKLDIPPDVGFMEGGCQRAIYTLNNDGTVYAEWVEEAEFEFGHFLWISEFPLKDMEESKSKIYVNDKESPHYIKHPIQDGYHYKGVFTSKDFSGAGDSDFLPEDIQD